LSFTSKSNKAMPKNRFISIVILLGIIAIIVWLVMPGKEYFSRKELIPNFEDLQKNLLKEKGNAWGKRDEIIAVLQKFQSAYAKRDSVNIDDFMEELFVEDNQILILGTEPGEWYAGYEKARNLILSDWQKWGTLSIVIQDAYIVVNGNISWFATIGRVGWPDHNLPIRVTGILVNSDNKWKISKLQFQWDISYKN
jgi:hypothetical protein